MNLTFFTLFFLSGAAALIYEVVCLHFLRLTIGISTYSLAVILSVVMGGMAVGSFLVGRLVPRDWHPLKVYSLIELGIGGLGLSVPFLLAVANGWYVSSFSWHEGSIFVRFLVATSVLLPPTVLMGTTLPIVSRSINRDYHGAAQVGWLYGANIFGAVVGSLFAGTVLMRYVDARTTSVLAAVLNCIAAVIAWKAATMERFAWQPRSTTKDAINFEQTSSKTSNATGLSIPMVALFFSGFAALGAEVVWTRLLTLHLGPTVYTFSLVLAVFLLGLGLGSSIASSLVTRIRFPLLALGICQVAVIAAIAHAANSFSDESLVPGSFWTLSFVGELPATLRDLIRCFVTLFPAACLWGASFPLAVAIVFPGHGDQARDVGMLTAANTLGAIGGAMAATLITVPRFGTQATQQLLIAASALAACCCMTGFLRNHRSQTWLPRKWQTPIGVVVIILLGMVGIANVRPPSPALFAYGREAAQRRRDAPYEVVREGVHTPIVVTLWPQHGGMRALHLAGKLEASDDKIDLRLERLLGHLPQFLCDDPKSVLVVGLGAGITAGTFVMDSRTRDLTICELEPTLPPITAKYFAKANRHVLDDPRTQLIIDDGRHYLQTTDRRFDVISVDPIHPWVRGAAALYSQEFFQQCLDHLAARGVVSYWVPMHSMTTESVKSEIATFFRVFPHAMLWHTGGTFIQRHMLLVGACKPFALDLATMDRLARSGSEIEASIRELEFDSPDDVLNLYVGDKNALQDWVKGAPINSDMSLKLEYLAGAAAFQNNREQIFRNILTHRTWPEELFRGDPARLRAIRENLDKFDALEDPVPKR